MNLARGINDVPPGIGAVNSLLNQFGDGDLGEKFTSWNITGNFDYAFDNVDLRTIINYNDATERWVSDFDGGGITNIFAGERNTFEQFAIESRAVAARTNGDGSAAEPCRQHAPGGTALVRASGGELRAAGWERADAGTNRKRAIQEPDAFECRYSVDYVSVICDD